jgi:hypothetical protein
VNSNSRATFFGRLFIPVAFGPSLAPYSGAERNPFKLQTYSDCRLASNPILLISIGRPGVEASRDSTEQRGTRHYVVVWLFRTRYRQFEFTLLRQRVHIPGARLLNRSKKPACCASFGCAAAPEKTNLVLRRAQDAIKFSVGEW